MSTRGLSIDERDRLIRQENNRKRIEERRQKDAAAEEVARKELEAQREEFERQQQVGRDGAGAADNDSEVPKQPLAHHARARSQDGSGLDALLEKEEGQRRAQLTRMVSGMAVNAAPEGSKLKGFDAELHEKIADKQDPQLAMHLGKWIEGVTEQPCFDLYTCLRNGVALCILIDKVSPGVLGVPYNKRATVHMAQRDNIRLYLQACERFGMNSGELFEISDLHENRNIHSVVSNLVGLSRRARFAESFHGPYLEGDHGAPTAGPASNPMPPKKWHRRSRSGTAGIDPTGTAPPRSLSSVKEVAVASTYKSSAPEFNMDAPAKPRNRATRSTANASATLPPKQPTTSGAGSGSGTLVKRVKELQDEVDLLRAENEELHSQLRAKAGSPIAISRGQGTGRLAGFRRRMDPIYNTVGRLVVWASVVSIAAASAYYAYENRLHELLLPPERGA